MQFLAPCLAKPSLRLYLHPVARAISINDPTARIRSKPEWIQKQLTEDLDSTWSQRLTVASSLTLNVGILARSFSEINSWEMLAGAVATVIGGYLAADLLSEIYHWSIDNYGSKDTPIVGKQIDGFQRHHRYPWTITYRQLCNNISPICFASLPFSFLAAATHPGALIEIWSIVACVFILFSQQFHAWAHCKRSDLPTAVRLLQHLGLLVSTKMHCQHHRHPFNINYCIVSGIWNPPLDRYGLFTKLELLIFDRTGIKPRSWNVDNEVREAANYFADDQ